MERSEAIGELISALAKAQGEFGQAIKGTTNSAFNSKYADLAANIDAVRPALNKNGIALLQFPEVDLENQTVSVVTTLCHGEQFISQTFIAPAVGRQGFNVQSIGAATTYLRRYGIQALCGLASEDDDGNSVATDNKPIVKAKPRTEPAQVAQDPPAADASVRSTFLQKAKDLGWGMGETRKYLAQLFPEAKSTASLTEKQLSDTLEAFAGVKPEEFFAEPTPQPESQEASA
jgi:hypothetical protein